MGNKQEQAWRHKRENMHQWLDLASLERVMFSSKARFNDNNCDVSRCINPSAVRGTPSRQKQDLFPAEYTK